MNEDIMTYFTKQEQNNLQKHIKNNAVEHKDNIFDYYKNKEINEILYVLKQIVIGRASRLTPREAKKILDYITNLEECHKNMFDINLENDKLIWNLQQENERLKAQVKLLEDNRIYLNNKIDKAIKYINDEYDVDPHELYGLVDADTLLNILRGKDNE